MVAHAVLTAAAIAHEHTDLLDGAQLAEAGLAEERAENAQRRLFRLCENTRLQIDDHRRIPLLGRTDRCVDFILRADRQPGTCTRRPASRR